VIIKYTIWYILQIFYIFAAMSKADRTRRYIAEKTAPLFNTKGYEGTSLADLVAVTGLTKGALYGNYNDKQEIAEAAFRYAIGKVKTMVGEAVAQEISYRKRVEAVVDFFAKYVNNPPIAGGCPLLNTAIEADDHLLSMRGVVTEELMSTITFIAGLLEKGVAAGEFKSGIEPQALAYIFFCSVEGALMFSRVERSAEPMEIIVQHCKKILDQISQ
jgi:TetR/AcrR family transcriptional regulator, transcriptional repressor for nem operon